MNRQFRVNGIPRVETRIELVAPAHGGWEAHITSVTGSRVRESYEFISDEFLGSCVRSGHLSEERITPSL